jgi:myosin heavy subunit
MDGFNIESSSPTFELIEYLKNKLKTKILEYEDEIRKKDELISDLKSQIESLNKTIENLKKMHSEMEENLINQNKELILKMEESKNIFLKQKEKHQKEISLLKSIFEKTKSDLYNLSKELESIKKEKEELRKKAVELEKEKTTLQDKLKMLENQLVESKKAVEESFSNLLQERNKTAELNKKITSLSKENEELKKQLENTRLAWDNERTQWKEMWEREKSLWESHRMEFAVWEERLRQEREAWLKKMKEEEEKGVENAKALYKVLEDASKWSYKVSELMKLYANKNIVLPTVVTSSETIQKKISSTFKKIFGFALASFFVLSTIFYLAYDYKHRLRFSKISSYTLEDINYTSFVKRGDWYIFSHFTDGLVFKDKELKTITKINNFNGTKLKIVSLSKGGYNIWALDISSLKFLEIDPDTGKILRSFKTATIAPQGIAYDGVYLWSFDAITGLLYRYDINGEVNGISTYGLDGIKSVDNIFWYSNTLFVLSSNKLYRFKYTADKFEKISSQNIKNFVYCNLYNDDLYVLKDEMGVKKFEILKIKNKEML